MLPWCSGWCKCVVTHPKKRRDLLLYYYWFDTSHQVSRKSSLLCVSQESQVHCAWLKNVLSTERVTKKSVHKKSPVHCVNLHGWLHYLLPFLVGKLPHSSVPVVSGEDEADLGPRPCPLTEPREHGHAVEILVGHHVVRERRSSPLKGIGSGSEYSLFLFDTVVRLLTFCLCWFMVRFL